MVEPPDGEWGRYENGRWTGLVGMCQDREVDLTIAPLTVSVDRSKVMDFAYPFYYDKLVAIYKMPDAAGSKWKTLLWPFRWEVFLSLALTCIITVLLVYCVDRKLATKLKHRLAIQQKHSVMESSLMVCAVLLRQDCALPPISTPGRMIIGAFWLFTILIAAAYCGNLVAFLTIKKDIPPLKTLRDLVSQTQYIWGTIDGTLWMTVFEFSNRTDDQKIWDGLVKFNKTDTDVLAPHFPEHRQKVEKGNYVFFSERSILQMWAEDNCDLVFLDEIFYKVNFAIGFPLNSPYTRLFSEIMVDFEQNGLLHFWKRTRWHGNNKCVYEQQPGARVIGLVDIQSAFFVLALGLSLGILSLLIEWCWKHKLIKE
ncbi:glutamate receptor ionotropic, kainate 2-like [Gigantopelta aegis]|uniref:glutamate receptor ionotropic, kainate 2-like n=1 Tax=Gigantopelta aegis TaxID=1735272 RepID=UPI001B88B98A|nr:glutamate receptor ionotropic, kainate 2-like [Gigantopelta aegis]